MHRPSGLRLSIIAAAIIGGVWLTVSGRARPSTPSLDLHHNVHTGHNDPNPALCELYPDPGDLAIGVKTGATEDQTALRGLLRTSLQCASDVLILSDHEGRIDGRPSHDILTDFQPAAMQDNPDFDLYRAIRQLGDNADEQHLQELLTMQPAGPDSALPGKTAGWVLDKYKFLHIAEAAWRLSPGKQWYLFLETDTYISWPSFLRWLPTLDRTQRAFIGNVRKKDGVASTFAQGGSGILLSGDVVQQIAEQNLTRSWDERARLWKFGDFLFADFLFEELGLSVTDAHPAFNEHNATALPYTPESWCEPVITLHRVHRDSFDRLFASERAQQFRRFLRSDVYDGGFGADFRFPPMERDWDNMAEAREHRIAIADNLNAHVDALSCQKACLGTEKCSSFLFRNTTLRSLETMHECVLSDAFRLGHPKSPQELGDSSGGPDTARSWTSGWDSEKIHGWIATHRDLC